MNNRIETVFYLDDAELEAVREVNRVMKDKSAVVIPALQSKEYKSATEIAVSAMDLAVRDMDAKRAA